MTHNFRALAAELREYRQDCCTGSLSPTRSCACMMNFRLAEAFDAAAELEVRLETAEKLISYEVRHSVLDHSFVKDEAKCPTCKELRVWHKLKEESR